MRVMMDCSPFDTSGGVIWRRGVWPGKWISHPAGKGAGPVVMGHRVRFALAMAKTVRIHVSADQRYELFLDGRSIGRGPERGDRRNWFFETHDLELAAGDHVLSARHWWLGDLAPFAQATARPAFLCLAEGESFDLISTGAAAWESVLVGGYRWLGSGAAFGTGHKAHVIGSELAWNAEKGEGEGWVKSVAVGEPFDDTYRVDQPPTWTLTPATLPAMFERIVRAGVARHVESLTAATDATGPVLAGNHLPGEAEAWNRMLGGGGAITIPAHTIRRVIVDAGDYFCAYPRLTVGGGAGSSVKVDWAESLHHVKADGSKAPHVDKGNRDEIEGKIFEGIGDLFEPDGGETRMFSTLWWEAGRYLQILVTTVESALRIESLELLETHYPFEWVGGFESSEPKLAAIAPIALRTVEMCGHETYMDCPYYEQLQYIGDTRLEVLVTYARSADDRLPRKAIKLFDRSRKYPGFTQSRYPSRVEQTIPPFSAWWIGMLHDFMMYRGDRAFVADLMPGVRAVLDAFEMTATADGLISAPNGWNFIDWIGAWAAGVPPQGDKGVSASLNFKLAWICDQAAELEAFAGEPEYAALHRRRGRRIAAAATERFWDERRGALADDDGHTRFSQHVQCLALLGGHLDGDRRRRVGEAVVGDGELARPTIYFMHYLFETYRLLDRVDLLLAEMPLWYGHLERGLRTTVEQPEPTRSDCHAWAAHPVFHYAATLLGIRPSAPGFASVRIEPKLGGLSWASGSMVHPAGMVKVELREGASWVELPAGVGGEFVHGGKATRLSGGRAAVEWSAK